MDFKQIKIIKKNIHTLPLSDVARKANLTETQVLDYLKEKWTKDRYDRYIKIQELGVRSKAMQIPEENEVTNTSITEAVMSFNLVPWLKKNVWALLFLTIIAIAVYLNAMNHEFVSDDVDGILRDTRLGNLDYVFRTNLGSLRNLLIYFIYNAFGKVPFWFRLSSVISHILTVYVIYFLFSLFKNNKLALIGAALFAVHPMAIEAVTWISGGVYSNYTLLALLSFSFYLFIPKNKWYIVPSVILFLIGIFTSVNVVVLIPIFLLYEFAFGNNRKTYFKIVPYIVSLTIFGIFFVMPAFFDRTKDLQTSFYQETGWDNPIIVILIALTSYLRLILWPDALTLYHSMFDMTPFAHFIRAIALIIYAYLVFYFYKKNRKIFFWLVFYIFSLLLVITPFRISWMVAERYVYMGSIGIYFAIAYLFDWLTDKEKLKNAGYFIFVVILIALSVRTIIRNNDWKDPDTLYLSMEFVSYNDPKTHNNLGDVYGRRGQYEKSAYEFKKAIELKSNYGDAYFNLGNTYLQWGKDKWASAEASYKTALSINPNIWQGYAQLAYIYYYTGNFDLAYENVQKAMQINKDNVFIYNLAAMISDSRNDLEEGMRFLNIALKMDPNNKMTLDNLKILEGKLKK